MRKCNIIVILMGLVFLVCSCASKPLPPSVVEYAKDAIIIYVKADPQLNLYAGTPHTLFVCIYQIKDPNALNQLAGDQEGLCRLLECSLFDASITGAKKLIIQPGQQETFVLDRAEGTRYVAVVAGYSRIERDRILRLHEIPEKGYIRRFIGSRFDILGFELKLGPQQLQ
ncbi:MAG: type VI secretion system lipoprotein TssJ [Deltaproteobacteria bacterium]|nr:type VI secretion system lipoprotein TssJ [Deltaproteobacteria bacterium]